MKSEANRLLERIMRQIVTVLFSLFILYLTILSCFSTAAVNLNEQSYLIADSAWRNLAVEGLLLLAIVPVMKLYRKRHPEKDAENLLSGDKAVRFFAGKNASQWNNPDFEGWWINAAMPNDGQSVLPVWLEKLLSVPGYYSTIFRFLNYLQFIILSGVILHLLLGSSRKDVYLLLMITFLGGFLFHTF
ncbi:MAG: hypothetical protein Q4F43_05630 [Eubacteriales bacterium]|nr:hypothetical protein [Eubacteriales bacterium]